MCKEVLQLSVGFSRCLRFRMRDLGPHFVEIEVRRVAVAARTRPGVGNPATVSQKRVPVTHDLRRRVPRTGTVTCLAADPFLLAVGGGKNGVRILRSGDMTERATIVGGRCFEVVVLRPEVPEEESPVTLESPVGVRVAALHPHDALPSAIRSGVAGDARLRSDVAGIVALGATHRSPKELDLNLVHRTSFIAQKPYPPRFLQADELVLSNRDQAVRCKFAKMEVPLIDPHLDRESPSEIVDANVIIWSVQGGFDG